MTPNIGKTAINEVVETTLRGVAHILSAAGLGQVDGLVATLKRDFEQNLRRIAQSASRVSNVMKEHTVSTEFRTFFIEHRKEFNTSTMENLYEGYGPSSTHGKVLCTTEIGLQCFTNLRKDERDRNLVERRIVLRPKILLESVIELLDDSGDEDEDDEY